MKYKKYQTGKATCTHCGHASMNLGPINALKMECRECGMKSAKWNRFLKHIGIDQTSPKRAPKRRPQTTRTVVGNHHKYLL